jgi:hypothetical protein
MQTVMDSSNSEKQLDRCKIKLANRTQKRYLPTELAEVLGVLRHLHLLDLLTQASTIPSSCNIVICIV